MVTEVLDGDGNKSGKKKAKPASFKSKYQKNWDVLVVYVDLYKHHFDLSVKAYVIYLAIIGTDASFVFRQDIDRRTRTPLLLSRTYCVDIGYCGMDNSIDLGEVVWR